VLFGEHVGVGGLCVRLPQLLQLSLGPQPPELLRPGVGCLIQVRPVANEKPALDQSGVVKVGGAVDELPWPSWCNRSWPRPLRAGGLKGLVG
jgi:hypothetical protein